MTCRMLLAACFSMLSQPEVPRDAGGPPTSGARVIATTRPAQAAAAHRYFETKLSLKDVEVGDLFRRFGVKPPFSIEGRFSIATQVSIPFDAPGDRTAYRLKGTMASPQLRIAGLNLCDVSAEVNLDQGLLAVTEIKASVAGASFNGQAQVRLDGAYSFEAKGVLCQFDLAVLRTLAPSFRPTLATHGLVTLGGEVHGQFQDGHALEGLVTWEAPSLWIQHVPIQQVHGHISYKSDQIAYAAEGAVLGGRFRLQGQLAPTSDPQVLGAGAPAPAILSGGHFSLEGVRLRRLGEILGECIPDGGGLGGGLWATLDYSHDRCNYWPTGTGRLFMRHVHYGQNEIAEEVRACLHLTDEKLQIRDIDGTLGEGLLRGSISLYFHDRERSHFSLNLEHVEASRLLAPIPGLCDTVRGPIEANLRGTLASEWRITGPVVLSHGGFLGIGVTQWRLPIDLTFVPMERRGQLEIRDSMAQVASGRATGQMSLSWGTDTRLQGSVRFLNADFQALAARSASLRGIALGSVTGRFDFAAPNLRTVDDLIGVFEATLARSQALELPVLNVLVPFLTPGRSALTFEQGQVRARLVHGAFNLQRLSLISQALKMVVEGTVRLNGQLDLNVTAQTGGFNLPGIGFLATKVPMIGPVPVSLIAEASTLLGSRVIHLRIAGTVTSPNVQVAYAPLLTEEAVRLLLLANGLPVPSEASLQP